MNLSRAAISDPLQYCVDEQPPNYHSEFLKSPHHAWWGLGTVGLGFLLATPLTLIAGATAYALGWIYMPDMPFFKSWVGNRVSAAKRQAMLVEVAAFVQRRDALLGALTPVRRERYAALAAVCQDIESASADAAPATEDPDPRMRKLDELMWTFLRLLSIEESLERFLEIERRDNLPKVSSEAEHEVERLTADLAALKAGGAKDLDGKERFRASRVERLEVLRKRIERSRQAGENLALVVSEQERLDQQIKLIRADAVASKNTASLTARIDATVEHLDETNKWLSEMDEFKDLVGDLPQTEMRVGFGATETRSAPPRARQTQ